MTELRLVRRHGAVLVPDVHGVQPVVPLQGVDLGVGDEHGRAPLQVGDAGRVRPEVLAPVHEGDRGGQAVERERPVDGAVAAADDDDVLPGVGGELLDDVGQAAALPLRAAGQRAGGEGADPAGDDDGAGADPGALVGGDDEPLAGPRAVPGLVGEVLGPLAEHVDRVEAGGLLDQSGDQVAALDPGEAGDVVDHLLRVERRHLAAGLREAVDDRRPQAAEAGVVGGVEPGRAGPDDQQVDVDPRPPSAAVPGSRVSVAVMRVLRGVRSGR